jgi:hypothetical protein
MKVSLAQYDSRKSPDAAGHREPIPGHHSPTVTLKDDVHVRENDRYRKRGVNPESSQ